MYTEAHGPSRLIGGLGENAGKDRKDAVGGSAAPSKGSARWIANLVVERTGREDRRK